MDQSANKALGQKGEKLAARFLEKNGHTLVSTNFRSGRSELDIISVIDKTLVVSEVKSFHSDPLGAAEFRVTKSKQKHVIIVDFSQYPAQITQHKSAFYDDQNYFY